MNNFATLTLADTCLLWGHRLSEWCGHGPQLEEDIALTNTALDVIGQARALYQLVASRSSEFATEDKLAYFRDANQFQNIPLAEAENRDYAQTIVRSLMLSTWFVPTWEALEKSSDVELAGVAREAVKAARVAFRHANEWTIRFGDGTAESRRRVEAAIATLAPYTHSLLTTDIEGTDREARSLTWMKSMNDVMQEATLPPWPAPIEVPLDRSPRIALLNEMQSLTREHPEATW